MVLLSCQELLVDSAVGIAKDLERVANLNSEAGVSAEEAAVDGPEGVARATRVGLEPSVVITNVDEHQLQGVGRGGCQREKVLREKGHHKNAMQVRRPAKRVALDLMKWMEN